MKKVLVSAFVLLFAVFAYSQKPAKMTKEEKVKAATEMRQEKMAAMNMETLMMQVKKEEMNKAAIGSLLQSFGTGNTENIDNYIHEDFVNHHAAEGLQDRAGFHQIVQYVHGIFSTFDELDLKPAILFAKDDFVAMMDVGKGMKNGKVYEHKDIHIFRMKDGKMIEHWNSFRMDSQEKILIEFLESTK